MKALRKLRLQIPWIGLTSLVIFLYVFMFLPILITAAVSFNSGTMSKFPPSGFSLRWWGEALQPRWLEPLLFSLQLSTMVAIIVTILGLPVAFGLVRYRFVGRNTLTALFLSPLIMPAIVTGLGLLQFIQFMGLGFLRGIGALLISHVVLCIPFSVRTIAISLITLPAKVEQAATSLGAHSSVVFLRITLPLIKSGVFAGAMFAFIASFTDYSVSLFLTRAGMRPITLAILSFLEFGFAPTLAAVAVITLIVPLTLVIAIQHFFGISDFIYASRKNG
jgi:putative spermidine/putrescine transport system permease protein